MGVRRPVPDPDDRGRPPARPPPARGLQRPALDRARRGALAVDAPRPAALAHGLPADAALAAAGCFEAIVHDLRALLRVAQGREEADGGDPRRAHPAIDARERRAGRLRRGQDAARAARCTSPWTRWATCWPCMSRPPTSRSARRSRRWPQRCRRPPGRAVELAYRRPGLHRRRARRGGQAHGIRLEVVKLPEAKRGFVLLPRRWVVERSFAWAARFRRLARDYERLPETLAGLHFVAFAILMLARVALLPKCITGSRNRGCPCLRYHARQHEALCEGLGGGAAP